VRAESVWLVTAEVAMDGQVGFLNVTLWASSAADATTRLEEYLGSYDWELLSTSRVTEVNPQRDHGEELNEMIDETLSNRNFIRLGTYITYPLN
jgi:hypothetical protein